MKGHKSTVYNVELQTECLCQAASYTSMIKMQCVFVQTREVKGGLNGDERKPGLSLPSCFVRLSTQKRLSSSWKQTVKKAINAN